MSFEEILNIIKENIDLPSDREYDGLIVKKLEASNTLDEGRSTNQTHIAITGPQMGLFPYLAAEGYFNCNYDDKDDGLKKYIFLKLPINIFKSNVNSLVDDKAKDIFSGTTGEYIKTYVCLVRSRRKDGSDQIQMSLTQQDGGKFVEFRKCLHQGDYLVILKLKGSVEYDCFGISKCNIEVGNEDFKKLNNTFSKNNTNTGLECDKFIVTDEINEKKLEYTEDSLAAVLKKMRDDADEGNKAVQIHIFGLYYGHIIDENNLNTKKILELANVPESYEREINKMKNLYEYLVENNLISTSEKVTEKDNTNREKFGINRLFYGVPGVGKSYTVKNETIGYTTERVVFHPDYTYADFVGQILPKHNEKENRLEYKFTPGPFTKILKIAENNPEMKCCLIIEELNRGNAPAIFGELFQLLDRSENDKNFGESVYGVTNHDIAKEVYGDENHEVKIPSNLSIYATMNTSDQNVFTLDTAFQRRWFMTYIPNKFDKAHAADIIKDTEINWGAFATVVNECLHNDNTFMSTEDKSLGVFFATAVDTSSKERFAEKVLKYLWDDAFKLDRTPLFKDNIKSFGQLMMYYYDAEGDALEAVIKPEVYADMKVRCAKYADITQ